MAKSQVDSLENESTIDKSVQQYLNLFELIASTHSMFHKRREESSLKESNQNS